MRRRPYAWLVPGVVAGALVPLVVLAVLSARGRLGADPISIVLNQLGLVAMILLVASLACTPLKTVSGWRWPARIRRALGLIGFLYASLHVATYVAFDRLFDIAAVWEDVTGRPFIVIGAVAYLMLVPLALTSTAGSPRRLGRNWQRLHRLAYLISPLVIVHFAMRMKADISQPLAYGAVLATLLAVRVARRAVRWVRAPAWTGYREFRVAKKESDVGGVCSLYLAPLDGKRLRPFKPGQFLTLRLDTGEPHGTVIRCYSMSERPDPGHYRISVKRVTATGPDSPPGVASNYLHDHVPVGTVLEAKAPVGTFFVRRRWRRAHQPLVFIAGGIGVTPLLAILDALTASALRRDVYFFLGVRNSGDHCFRAELAEMVSRHAAVRLHVAYSAPLATDRVGSDYDHSGRISVALLRDLLPTMACDFYVCGPPSMMAQLKADLADVGVPPGDFHMEAFGAASVKRLGGRGPTAGTVFVTFEQSGVTVEWDPSLGSLLELAEAHGVNIDNGCRAGSCGTCEVSINYGDVVYEFESGADPGDGACLTCVTVPETDLNLEA